jgi:erythromycin esterase
MLEDGTDKCADINHYIKTGKGNLKSLMHNLYPVWSVKELAELITWLKDNCFNYPIEFVGFDIDQTKKNIGKRDKLMAENINRFKKQRPDTKALIWAHNTHIKISSETRESEPMGMFLKEKFGKDYFAIAQFFGTGDFSAAYINKNNPNSKYRTLRQIQVAKIPSTLLESQLNIIGSKPYFLMKEEFGKKGLNRQSFVRSIGWGLVPEQLENYVEKCDIKKEFDGLIYFPVAKRSNPI